jgi:hypothetical protein
MRFPTLPLPAQWVEQASAIFVISEMRPVKPEKIARGKIARGLCLNDSYACAFGYCQNGRRLEPTREPTLGTHVLNAQVHSIGPQTRKQRKNALFRSEYFPDSLFSMSAIGTKRTSACALHMSAFDPKRTLPSPSNFPV